MSKTGTQQNTGGGHSGGFGAATTDSTRDSAFTSSNGQDSSSSADHLAKTWNYTDDYQTSELVTFNANGAIGNARSQSGSGNGGWDWLSTGDDLDQSTWSASNGTDYASSNDNHHSATGFETYYYQFQDDFAVSLAADGSELIGGGWQQSGGGEGNADLHHWGTSIWTSQYAGSGYSISSYDQSRHDIVSNDRYLHTFDHSGSHANDDSYGGSAYGGETYVSGDYQDTSTYSGYRSETYDDDGYGGGPWTNVVPYSDSYTANHSYDELLTDSSPGFWYYGNRSEQYAFSAPTNIASLAWFSNFAYAMPQDSSDDPSEDTSETNSPSGISVDGQNIDMAQSNAASNGSETGRRIRESIGHIGNVTYAMWRLGGFQNAAGATVEAIDQHYSGMSAAITSDLNNDPTILPIGAVSTLELTDEELDSLTREFIWSVFRYVKNRNSGSINESDDATLVGFYELIKSRFPDHVHEVYPSRLLEPLDPKDVAYSVGNWFISHYSDVDKLVKFLQTPVPQVDNVPNPDYLNDESWLERYLNEGVRSVGAMGDGVVSFLNYFVPTTEENKKWCKWFDFFCEAPRAAIDDLINDGEDAVTESVTATVDDFKKGWQGDPRAAARIHVTFASILFGSKLRLPGSNAAFPGARVATSGSRLVLPSGVVLDPALATATLKLQQQRLLQSLAPRDAAIWGRIKATQEVWPGTHIPRSFELTTQSGQRVWVHGNATEHLAERIVGANGPRMRLELGRVTQQAQLESLESAVNAATRGGVVFDKPIRVGGWELIFGRPRNPGDLPTLFHALPLE